MISSLQLSAEGSDFAVLVFSQLAKRVVALLMTGHGASSIGSMAFSMLRTAGSDRNGGVDLVNNRTNRNCQNERRLAECYKRKFGQPDARARPGERNTVGANQRTAVRWAPLVGTRRKIALDLVKRRTSLLTGTFIGRGNGPKHRFLPDAKQNRFGEKPITLPIVCSQFAPWRAELNYRWQPSI